MLKMTESFDYLPTSTGLPANALVARVLNTVGWNFLGTYMLGLSNAGRFGGKALWFGGQAAAGSDAERGRAFWPLQEPVNKGFLGIALNVGDLSDFIVWLTDTTLVPPTEFSPFYGAIYSVRITTLGAIQVRSHSVVSDQVVTTQIALTQKVVTKGSWFYLELGWGPEGLEVRINTIPVVSLPTATKGGVNSFGLSRTFSGSVSLADDIYLCDDQGSVNNYFLGNVRVQALTLASNFSTQWDSYNLSVPNWQAASNQQLDDTSYVRTSIDNEGYTDLYNVAPLANAAVIYGMAVKGAYRQDDATQGLVQNALSSAGTLWQGAPRPTFSSYTFHIDILELNPHTSSNWLYTEVNLVKIGPRQA